MTTPAPKRCAVYCRVSSDERLDQSFNSIDAQREAGLAYIASQRSEGWIAVDNDYLDPGYSGGNTERPGLKRLMADIGARQIDVVVVYKIDRLTRSLTDFAKLIDVFERAQVSFVAVTQQFNTTTSMGRLMLNILLSFAQFEREVTSERIRDKFAASKAKGMWMGGVVPLGYRVEARKLLIEPTEARAVRRIFEQFAECHSITTLARELDRLKITSRTGTPFTKQGLWKLLNNRIYRGQIVHKGEAFPGLHDAIIDQPLWDRVQSTFAANPYDRKAYGWGRRGVAFLLAGLVTTEEGERLVCFFSTKPDGRRYRYYIPSRTLNRGASHPVGRLPAGKLEALVVDQILGALTSADVVQAAWKATRGQGLTEPEVVLPLLHNIADIWESLYPQERARITRILIERVVVSETAVTIVWHDQGWPALVEELGSTIGAELTKKHKEGRA